MTLILGLVACAGAYVAYGLVTRPASRTPARFWLAVALLLAGSNALVWNLYQPITDLTGIPNLARLLGHLVGGVAAACAVQSMLRHWAYPPDEAARAVRRQQIISGLIALAMVVLFFTSVDQTQQEPLVWQDRYAHIPQVAAYVALFNGALGWMLLDLGRISWRYARQMEGRKRTRISLRLFAAGGWTGMVYVATQILNTIATLLGIALPQTVYVAVVSASQYICFLCIAAAAVIPGIGAATTRSRRAIVAARLEPLWRAFRDVFPTVLQPPPSGLAEAIVAGLTAKDDYPLHRMVIQIRDGYLALRPWFDSNVAQVAQHYARAAGMRGEKLAATVEAATVIAALRAKQAGRAPAGTGQVEAGSADMAGEARWLSQVSRACAKSTVVRQVLDQITRRSWVDEQLDALGMKRAA